jgi:hypothetical protein
MAKSARLLASFLFTLALVALAGDGRATSAQTTLTGDWKASLVRDMPEKTRDDKDDSDDARFKPGKLREKAGELNLSFERFDGDGRSQMGQTYDFSDFQRLGREQVERGGAVRFQLVREAGTIECEGTFADRKGAGTFRFTPNQSFVAAMRSRGFDFEQEPSGRHRERSAVDRLFAAATLNVTTALADDLLSADFGKLDVDDLFKAAIFKVDSKFMREMKASGFPGLGMEELVKARIFKIDADFVREAARMGFDKESFEGLVKMRIFKVTPEFIAEVRGEGLGNLSIEELVKLRIFKIDSDFIRRAKADGVPLEVEELVHRRIMGGRARSRSYQE